MLQIVENIANPAVSTAAYAAGDVVGGKMSFGSMARTHNGAGLLQTVLAFFGSSQTAILDLLVFHTDPTASTFTDNDPLAVALADFDKLVGVIHLSDWTNLGSRSVVQADNLSKAYKLANTTLFGVLVTRSAMTLASTADVEIALRAVID